MCVQILLSTNLCLQCMPTHTHTHTHTHTRMRVCDVFKKHHFTWQVNDETLKYPALLWRSYCTPTLCRMLALSTVVHFIWVGAHFLPPSHQCVHLLPMYQKKTQRRGHTYLLCLYVGRLRKILQAHKNEGACKRDVLQWRIASHIHMVRGSQGFGAGRTFD